ncbi:MAG: restriction endonuclease [Pseudomonadota bacterium]
MIRSGRGSEHVEAFLEHGIVAIGWPALGALLPATKKDDLLRQYATKYPQDREGRRLGAVSQILRFLNEIQIGDQVVTYDRDRRLYAIGEVLTGYEWQPESIGDLPHARKVKWTREVARDALSTGTRNTLGTIQTLFKLSNDAAKDLASHAQERGRALAVTPPAPAAEPLAEDEEARAALVNESIEKADDFIEDAINELDWQQVQELVAGILRAMGYRTSVSEPGPDRGVDIRASPDGLGLQEPRIFVEVKHRGAQMGSKEIRAFLGGRKPGDKCLYVSTGGFSKDAWYEAERASVATTLITLPILRRLLIDYYESLDTETRALVPLRRLYWPDARKS